MGRNREFDPEEIAEKAMHLFWQNGYSETSVRDLVQATGVSHAGLYTAFEDKEGLFVAALAKYQKLAGQVLYARLNGPDAGLHSVRDFFKFILNASKEGPFTNGCMMANSAVEFGASNDRVQKATLANLVTLTKAFKNSLDLASKRGDLPNDRDTAELAASLATTFQGLSVLIKARAPRKMLKAAVNRALFLLE